MFQGTPYAHNALGSRHSFNLTTGAMLRKFHAAWYAPNNAILIITGDVHPHRALAQVKKDFGGISAKKLPQTPGHQTATRAFGDDSGAQRPALRD